MGVLILQVVTDILALSLPLAHAAVCPGVTAGGPSCEGPEDCTELQCQLQANEFFVNGTSSISLDPCDDPPLITFSLQWLMDGSFVSMTYQLSDSGTMLLMGPVNISATVEKNATSLAFSVSTTTFCVTIQRELTMTLKRREGQHYTCRGSILMHCAWVCMYLAIQFTFLSAQRQVSFANSALLLVLATQYCAQSWCTR